MQSIEWNRQYELMLLTEGTEFDFMSRGKSNLLRLETNTTEFIPIKLQDFCCKANSSQQGWKDCLELQIKIRVLIDESKLWCCALVGGDEKGEMSSSRSSLTIPSPVRLPWGNTFPLNGSPPTRKTASYGPVTYSRARFLSPEFVTTCRITGSKKESKNMVEDSRKRLVG